MVEVLGKVELGGEERREVLVVREGESERRYDFWRREVRGYSSRLSSSRKGLDQLRIQPEADGDDIPAQFRHASTIVRAIYKRNDPSSARLLADPPQHPFD